MKCWKKLSICSISFLACFFAEIAINVACGPEEDPYDYHLSFFHNNLQGGAAYSSFYYTNYPFLYDDSEPEDEQVINAKEWAAHLGKTVKIKDVKKLFYNLDLATYSALQKVILKPGTRLPDSLKTNTCLKALTSAKNRPALKYYLFAKSVEPLAAIDFDWDAKPKDVNAYKQAGQKALSNALAQKDSFIKLRYLFQAVRLFHYGNHYKEAVSVYDKYIKNHPSASHAKGWALAVKAGAERRLGDTITAAYHFSEVFARYPERRIQAYKNYHYIGAMEGDVIKQAKNKKQRAYIYAIEAFNTSELNLQGLQKVYKCYPASDMVGVLLIREINKLEEYYLTPKYSSKLPDKPYRIYDEPLTKSSTKTYETSIQNLKHFCQTLYTERRYRSPGLGKLAIAYLEWMQNNTRQGIDALNELEAEKLIVPLNNQKHLISLLLTTQSIKRLNQVNQAQLLGDLQWLDKMQIEEKNAGKDPCRKDYWYEEAPERFAVTARDFYQFVLTPAYLKQGDTTMAALTILKSETITNPLPATGEPWQYQMLDFWQYYLNSPRLIKLIGWKHNKPADPYMAFLTADLKTISNSDLKSLLGTMYIREHQYKKAVKILSVVKPHKKDANGYSYYYSGDNLSDPFIDQLPDYPKTYYKSGNAVAYTKLMFARAMLKLQQQIKSDHKNAARYYYKMAVGLYNTSFYGNANYLIAYAWQARDYGRASKLNYDNDYMRATNAKRCFIKARSLSTDPEFKARCTFMAAKCAQKQVVYTSDYSSKNYNKQVDDYDSKVRSNPYFAQLKQGYSKTAFYKTAVDECSYLRDFLNSQPKKLK
jgi:hypothetical protein